MDEQGLLALVNLHEKNSIGSSSTAANIATAGTTTEYGSVDVERAQAMDYYHGRPLGNEVEGRSQVVSQEVRDTIEWAMPQIMRMFVTSKTMVRFDPDGPQDEAQAQQITDAVNYVLMRQNEGVLILHDFFKDALMLKNGYVKVYYDTEDEVQFDNYTGLTPDQLVYVVQQIEAAGDEAEIVAKHEVLGVLPVPQPPPQPGQPPAPPQVQPNVTLDVRIKRTTKRHVYRCECIAPEDMRIAADAGDDIQKAAFVGHVVRKTRSEWKALGYDVASEPADNTARIDIQSIARSDTVDELASPDAGSDKSMQIVEGLECYMRVDWDGDGYAELRKILKAPGKIVANDPLDEIPIAYCVPVRMPHRHLGISYFDLTKDLQDIKTTLIRQMLDNTYLVNNGRPVYNQDTVNAQDLMLARPGGGIRVKGPVAGQVDMLAPPPISQQLLPVIDYADSMKAQRTGISPTTQGLDPDTLQETTAKAYTVALNAAGAKVELIARMLAEGVKQIAVLLQGLLIRHQDKPMMINLRDQWVPIDPSTWRKHYACSVNVGLGTGSRDEMRSNLMLLGQVQQAAAQAGIISPQNVYALASEMAETLGFPVAGRYFTDPDSPQFQQLQQQRQQKGSDPKVQAAQISAKAHVQQAQITAQGNIAQVNAEQQMHTQELLLKAQVEKQRADAQLAKAAQDGQADVITAYLSAKQKHDQALMDLITQNQQSESQERQNFIKSLASVASSAQGMQNG